MLNRREQAFARHRANGMCIAEAQRLVGCAPSTAADWQKLPAVIAEIDALKAASSSDTTPNGEDAVDEERELEQAIHGLRQKRDFRGIVAASDMLSRVKQRRGANELPALVASADPDALVAALQHVSSPMAWLRIADMIDRRGIEAGPESDAEALALLLSSVWLKNEPAERWLESVQPLLDCAGSLVHVIQCDDDAAAQRVHADLRVAITNARAALDRIEQEFSSPTSAAGNEPAHSEESNTP
ncbi:MAG TPA: hypothetical protein VG755_15845 [Nannocystaceae bacterium]|nr:hypothetical protein [Nannocystaceae bacterium]